MKDHVGQALLERVVLLALAALGIAFAGALSTFFVFKVLFGMRDGFDVFFVHAWPFVLLCALFGGLVLVPLLLPTDLRRSLPVVTGVVMVSAPLAILLTGAFGLMVCYALASAAMLWCNVKWPYRPASASNSA